MSELREKAQLAQIASKELAHLSSEAKNLALKAIAERLLANEAMLLEANARDVAAGRARGMEENLIDRLLLTPQRIADIGTGVLQVMALTDPVGELLSEFQRPNGLEIRQIRVPLGVVGMVYEARPNVTVDAAVLCLKSGNSALLRGSSSALQTNIALVQVIHEALSIAGTIPKEAVQLLEDTSRTTATEMFKLNEYLDVLIPRGGSGLIQSVVREATVPVLETGVGNCHIYIDESADLDMAINIVINAKTQRPSVCNAAETILVQEDWAAKYLPILIEELHRRNVQLVGDAFVLGLDPAARLATESDWKNEYLCLTVAVGVVKDVEEAISHIDKYGSKHSEAIVSEDLDHVRLFLERVDAAAVYHNASTRFTDGFEFGFGAEIGISTQKLHARGPMGLEALTSSKYLVLGSGQIRG